MDAQHPQDVTYLGGRGAVTIAQQADGAPGGLLLLGGRLVEELDLISQRSGIPGHLRPPLCVGI